MKTAADFQVSPDNTTVLCKKCGWTSQIVPQSVKRQPGKEDLAAVPFQALAHIKCK